LGSLALGLPGRRRFCGGSATASPRGPSPEPGGGGSSSIGVNGGSSHKMADTRVCTDSALFVQLGSGAHRSVHAAPEIQRSRASSPDVEQMDSDATDVCDTQQLPHRSQGRHRRVSEFDVCVRMAKKFLLPVEAVKQQYDIFTRLDDNGNGLLSPDEFETVVRNVCSLSEEETLPAHLFQEQWKQLDSKNRGVVGFEEFLIWSVKNAFAEEVVVGNERERENRGLARALGFCLLDIERIRRIFEQFDGDGSGCVDKDEFKSLLCHVMKVKHKADIPDITLSRYFREVDVDGSGDIDFEEFTRWYINVHGADAS